MVDEYFAPSRVGSNDLLTFPQFWVYGIGCSFAGNDGGELIFSESFVDLFKSRVQVLTMIVGET